MARSYNDFDVSTAEVKSSDGRCGPVAAALLKKADGLKKKVGVEAKGRQAVDFVDRVAKGDVFGSHSEEPAGFALELEHPETQAGRIDSASTGGLGADCVGVRLVDLICEIESHPGC